MSPVAVFPAAEREQLLLLNGGGAAVGLANHLHKEGQA